MKNPLKSENSNHLGLLLARLPIGAFMLVAGIFKVNGGVHQFVLSNIANVPASVPHDWGRQYLHAVPYLEIVIGAMLVLGLLTRLAALIAALMVITYTIGATGLRPPNMPFTPNLIYIGILLLVFLVGPGRFSADGAFSGRSPSRTSGPTTDYLNYI